MIGQSQGDAAGAIGGAARSNLGFLPPFAPNQNVDQREANPFPGPINAAPGTADDYNQQIAQRGTGDPSGGLTTTGTPPGGGGSMASSFTEADWARYAQLSPEERQRFLSDPAFRESFLSGGQGAVAPGGPGGPGGDGTATQDWYKKSVMDPISKAMEQFKQYSNDPEWVNKMSESTGEGETTPPAKEGFSFDVNATFPYGSDDYWRYQDKIGAYQNTFNTGIYNDPNYAGTNPRWQNYVESRAEPLIDQFKFAQNFGPHVGFGGPSAESPHFQSYLGANPAIGRGDWWGSRLGDIYGAASGAPAGPGEGGAPSEDYTRWEIINQGLNDTGVSALSQGLGGSLHPEAQSAAQRVLGNRYKRWSTQNPMQGQGDFFKQQYPGLSYMYGSGAAA